MKGKTLFVFYCLFFAFFLSCKTRRSSEDTNSEFAAIKFSDHQQFKYFYYSSTLTSIEHYYCKGHYTQSGNNYQLFPDSIDPNNFAVECQLSRKPNIEKSTELEIGTNIMDGPLDLSKYKITVFNDSLNLVFHGVNVDTLLSNVYLRKFRIKVDLREDYAGMLPKPTFTSIITKNINVPESFNHISIKVPVPVELFYYRYKKQINIKDGGKYWIIDDKKVLKKNNYPI